MNAATTRSDSSTAPTAGTVAVGVMFTLPHNTHIVLALLQAAGIEVGEALDRWAVVVNIDTVALRQGAQLGRLMKLHRDTPVIPLVEVCAARYRVA